MKKSEPKMILNVAIENKELDEKVKIALDKYVEDLIMKNLDDTIAKYVVKRITNLVEAKYTWSPDSKLNGKSLEDYVREATKTVIEEAIETNIKNIFAKKVADMLSK